MKHQDFRSVAIGEAFDAIEASVLPSLTLLIESASLAEPGTDAEAHAEALRTLARELEQLTDLLQPQPDGDHPLPFRIEE